MSYNGTVRCGYCYQTGHNKRTCPVKNDRLRKRYLAAKENLALCEANGDDNGAAGYRTQMESYARQYTKRTRCNPDTGAPIVVTKEQKAAAKAERMKTITCSYCHEQGHTRRTCSILKEDRQVFIKAAQMVRAQRLEEMRNLGAGVGSMAIMTRYGYWGADQQWGSRERPMMLTGINWQVVAPNYGKSESVYSFQDAATLNEGPNPRDHYATSIECTRAVNGMVNDEKITCAGLIEPPAGWLEATDINFNQYYPSGKSRDWDFRDAENVTKFNQESSRYGTNHFIEARRSLDL